MPVFPQIAYVWAYSRDPRTIIEATEIRYPSRALVHPDGLRSEYANHLYRLIATAPTPFMLHDTADMPSNYSGVKRAAYERTLTQLAGWSSVLNAYTCFVKREILYGVPKPARVITAHLKATNLLFYPVAHGFEVSLLSILDSTAATPGQRALPFFAKGLNFSTRAQIIEQKMLPGWHCVSIDVSSFDNCIREAFFDGELDVFATLYPALDPAVFRNAYVYNDRSEYPNGDQVRELPRARKSGDLHTGSGNCAVMHFFCH